jgi:hypothetical protein
VLQRHLEPEEVERDAALVGAVLQQRQHRRAPEQHLALERLQPGAADVIAHRVEERGVPVVVLAQAVRGDVGDRGVHVIGEEAPEIDRGHPALAVARRDPTALVDRLERCHDAVVIGGGLLDRQIGPGRGRGDRGREEAVLHRELVRFEELRDLGRLVVEVVARAEEHRGRVDRAVQQRQALLEPGAVRVPVVRRLVILERE